MNQDAVLHLLSGFFMLLFPFYLPALISVRFSSVEKKKKLETTCISAVPATREAEAEGYLEPRS
jgi:hypothetical protein